MNKGTKGILGRRASPADRGPGYAWTPCAKKMAKAVADFIERRKHNPEIEFFCYINPRLRAIMADWQQIE